jgi:hypothetical protein
MKTSTIRDFAESNNLALPRLRNLLKKYGHVKIEFTRKSVNHYDIEKLDLWLTENKKRFSAEAVYVHLGNGETFYCSRKSHYVPNSKRGKMSLCCVDCEKEATVKVESEPSLRGKVPQHILDFNERKERIRMARELAAIEKDDWMEV